MDIQSAAREYPYIGVPFVICAVLSVSIQARS